MKVSPKKLVRMAEAAIRDDKLILPSPPDAMIQIMAVLEDDNASPQIIAAALKRDPALTARLIKVTNSASYQQSGQITEMTKVIPRLGLKLIKTLVTSHMLLQMFAQPEAIHKQRLKQIYAHSLQVARYAYALARYARVQSAEDALLAGLMHDIGYLPLLQLLKFNNMDETLLEPFLFQYHCQIGAQLLNKWHLSEAIVQAIGEHENWHRTTSGSPDLTDVVLIANLLSTGEEHPAFEDKAEISAYTRLGIEPDSDLSELTEYLAMAEGLLPVVAH